MIKSKVLVMLVAVLSLAGCGGSGDVGDSGSKGDKSRISWSGVIFEGGEKATGYRVLYAKANKRPQEVSVDGSKTSITIDSHLIADAKIMIEAYDVKGNGRFLKADKIEAGIQ